MHAGSRGEAFPNLFSLLKPNRIGIGLRHGSSG